MPWKEDRKRNIKCFDAITNDENSSFVTKLQLLHRLPINSLITYLNDDSRTIEATWENHQVDCNIKNDSISWENKIEQSWSTHHSIRINRHRKEDAIRVSHTELTQARVPQGIAITSFPFVYKWTISIYGWLWWYWWRCGRSHNSYDRNDRCNVYMSYKAFLTHRHHKGKPKRATYWSKRRSSLNIPRARQTLLLSLPSKLISFQQTLETLNIVRTL